MVSDFMVCVDRMLACFPSADSGVSPAIYGDVAAVSQVSCGGAAKLKSKSGEIIECRICQEEGDDLDFEAPCGCNGTLKFAHRKCIQKWCNKKGNIICEICNQVFSPNYSVPQPRSNPDVLAIDIRHSWGSRIDLHDSHFLALAAAEEELLNAEYEEYATAASSTNGLACCRAVALMLMFLLLIRHILIATRDIGVMQDISAMFNVSLEFIGIFLPCFVIIRSCYLIQSRRRRRQI